MQKAIQLGMAFCIWRKARDSNPRTFDSQRFSRPPHSTTLPAFQRQKYKLWRNIQKIMCLFTLNAINTSFPVSYFSLEQIVFNRQ